MSAQEYYGGSHHNSHTPGSSKRSSTQHLAAPRVDSAGYYPELHRPIGERPRSAMANRSQFGNDYYGHNRSRSTGPPGSDAELGTGKDGERGLLSTIGGGAVGGYVGKKLLGGKLGAVAGALGGSVVANKIEHRLSGSHHHSSSHHGHHSHHHGGPPPPYHSHNHYHHGPPPPPLPPPHHYGPPHHGGHHGSSVGFSGLVGSLMGGGKHHEHHGHHGHHGGPHW